MTRILALAFLLVAAGLLAAGGRAPAAPWSEVETVTSAWREGAGVQATALAKRACAKTAFGQAVPCPTPHALEPQAQPVAARAVPDRRRPPREPAPSLPPVDDHFRPPRA